MITVNDISVQFGGTTLFSDVTFSINENDKLSLFLESFKLKVLNYYT